MAFQDLQNASRWTISEVDGQAILDAIHGRIPYDEGTPVGQGADYYVLFINGYARKVTFRALENIAKLNQ